ncbi:MULTISPECIES: lipopolysaccharide biosynthesis protein [Clostridium]|uniref:lipopolysaccharide biosynthesis protein n=1 Tax=Clostridium TaxID=1485 RepID=UPI0018A9AD6F|nr:MULTISPECIES: hypothetical protein [Clostridium]MBS5306035.1 hypothetical protein [Clostridium sp.]MDB1969749.1 hypothetical protein [Clostridium tertium]
MNKKNTLVYNLSYAFIAQFISLFLSVLMSLLVPKMLGVTEYGYWQLFVFYSSYAGFFHLGLIDGIYLILGGKDKSQLKYEELKAQFIVLFIEQLIILIIINIIILFTNISFERKFIIFSTLFYMIIYNLSLFFGYIYQATNRTKLYSLSIIVDKTFFILSIVMLLIGEVKDFRYFIILYLFSKSLSLIFCLYNGREIIFAKSCGVKKSLILSYESTKIGINLMIANIASQLVLGIGRFCIDSHWGIENFGKISFSLQLTQFFLLFISQISMVLFPILRNVDGEKLKLMYIKARSVISIILPSIYVIYFPIKTLLSMWIPQYEDSLNYLIFMLPICIFDGKVQLLCNTYLKVIRKERILLGINIGAVAFSGIITVISIFLFDNLIITSVMMVVSIIFRSIICELFINKEIGETKYTELFSELIVTFIFVEMMWKYDNWLIYIILLFGYFIYLFINRNKLKEAIYYLKR